MCFAMVTISFPNWSDALSAADLPEKVRGRHRIIIQWFLGHLKRERRPASKASARAFIDHLLETRRPAEWQVEQWTDGLNWFFREAPSRRHVAEKEAGRKKLAWAADGGAADGAKETAEEAVDAESYEDGRQHYAYTVAEMQAKAPMDPWFEDPRKYYPVVYSKNEMSRLLEQDAGEVALDGPAAIWMRLAGLGAVPLAGQRHRSGAGEALHSRLERRSRKRLRLTR